MAGNQDLGVGVSAPAESCSEPNKAFLCFSDIDGTIVHYETMDRYGRFCGASQTSNLTIWKEKESELGGQGKLQKVLRLPPSHSGSKGTISVQTLALVAAIRAQGAKFILISGGRLTTLLHRLPFLPAADAYVCENGGRIFYPDNALPTACPLAEDMEWRAQHDAAAGPASEEWTALEQRKGALWDACRALRAAGWEPDTASYSTNFRLRVAKGKTDEDLRAAIEQLPPGLAYSFNLGCLDVYPATSGKLRAGIYLLGRFRSRPENSVLLCDDDNDLGLASLVRKAFLPSITSSSVEQAVASEPDKFEVASKGAILATEEMLHKVLDLLHKPQPPGPT